MTEEQLKKRAEEYAKKIEKKLLEDYEPIEYGTTPYLATIPTPHNKQAFIDGYHECQKEHEWHYVKDELPRIINDYFSNDLIFLTKDCSGNITKHFGYFCFRKDFEEYNTEDRFTPDEVIAWKEIVLPELPKEIGNGKERT